MKTKECKDCKTVKDITEFYDAISNKDGKNSKCKKCYNKYQEDYRDPLYQKEYRLKQHKTNPNYDRDRKRKQRQNNPEKHRNTFLLYKYGITLDQYNQQLKEQDYRCKICQIHRDSRKRLLQVDHCHKTSKVRGLLCVKCNQLLGRVKDNTQNIKSMINILSSAIKYLEDTL